MKTKLHLFRAAALLGPLVAALAGCANVPTRESTVATSAKLSSAAVTAANVDVPVPVRTVRPEYPEDLKRRGVSGVVRINCLVDEAGRVRDAKIENTAHDAFNRPALDALQQWTFTPGRRDGLPVAMRVSIPMSFMLQDW